MFLVLTLLSRELFGWFVHEPLPLIGWSGQVDAFVKVQLITKMTAAGVTADQMGLRLRPSRWSATRFR